MSNLVQRELVSVTYLPSTVSRGAPLQSKSGQSSARYDSGQTFQFAIPPQNAYIESMVLTCFVAITDSKGFEVCFNYDHNAGTISLDGGAGALGLFSNIMMFRGSTSTILSSKNGVARALKYTAMTKHEHDLIGHTNGIYVSPHFDQWGVDQSCVPLSYFETPPPTTGFKPVYFNPPIGVLNAGKGLNLANSGGVNLSFTVENAFNLLRSFFAGKGYYQQGVDRLKFINPIQNRLNEEEPINAAIGTTGSEYNLTILAPKLIVLLRSIKVSASTEDNFTFPEVNLLFLQEQTSLLQSINYTLQPALIEDFVIGTNYKNPNGNLVYGSNFNNGVQTYDFNFYLNGVIQTFAYPTSATPAGEQQSSVISNAFLDALSINVPDQYNYEAISAGKFLKVVTSGAGTGTSFNNTGVAIRLTFNPLVKSECELPFMCHPLSDLGVVDPDRSFFDGRNCISLGPDFKPRFCILADKDSERLNKRGFSLINEGTLYLVDRSFPELQTPSFAYVGAIAPSQELNTVIVTNQLFTLTMNPAATVVLPVAPVPVLIPECLVFKTCAGVSPIQYMQELQVPARRIPQPPPNTIQFEVILPTAGFIQQIYLNIVPKIVSEPNTTWAKGGWAYMTVIDQFVIAGYTNATSAGLLVPTLNNLPYTNATNGNPLIACHTGSLTNANPQATDPPSPASLSYAQLDAYCQATAGITVRAIPNVDLRGLYLGGYTPTSRNYSLHNQFSFSSTLGTLTFIRGLEVSFPTGVVARFDNVQDQALLENVISDPLLPTLQDSLLLNDYNIKCADKNLVRDVFDRLQHHKYNKHLSIFPVSEPGSSAAEKLHSDYPSYAQHMLRLSLNHAIVDLLKNTPLSPNLRIGLTITIDKRQGLAFAQVSAGVGCGVNTEHDVKSYLKGIMGNVSNNIVNPTFASMEPPVTEFQVGSVGIPLMTNFDWDITNFSTTFVMAYFSPSSQATALARFNATGVSKTFDLIDCQHRLRTTNTNMSTDVPFVDEITNNPALSIANQNVTSCRMLHRFLYRDQYNDFSLFAAPLQYNQSTSLQATVGLTGVVGTIPARAMYPYSPTEQSVPSFFKGYAEQIEDDVLTLNAPTFISRLQLPPYVACRRGGLGYSVPYAITSTNTMLEFAQGGYESLATFQAFGDGICMQPDLLLGTSVANQIMYGLLKGRVLFAQPEDVDFNPIRTLHFPEPHLLPSFWYSNPQNYQNPPNAPISLVQYSSLNEGWVASACDSVVSEGKIAFLRCPMFGESGFEEISVRGYAGLYQGNALLPSLHVDTIVFPPEFDNTIYFEVKCTNLLVGSRAPLLNWISGFPVGYGGGLKASVENLGIFMVMVQFFTALATDVIALTRSYAFQRQETITYSPYNAGVEQNFPGGYSISS